MKKFLLLLLVVLFVFTACDNSIKPIRFAFGESESGNDNQKPEKAPEAQPLPPLGLDNVIASIEDVNALVPLTIKFTAEDGGTINFQNYTGNMRFSRNNGEKEVIQENKIQAVKNDEIQLYAYNTSYIKIGCTGECEVSGNIMSLRCTDDKFTDFAKDFANKENVSQSAFVQLFKDNKGITSAENLLLPAKDLTGATSCYQSMFEGCENLKTAPKKLPATKLAQSCYQDMFKGCTSLTAAPELPAPIMVKSCYQGMFQSCSSLNEGKPELPAGKLAENCYQMMFYGCSSLEEAPILSAKDLVEGCYKNMFTGCSQLHAVTCLATKAPETSQYTQYWLSGVASQGTFTRKEGVYWPTNRYNDFGYPKEWEYSPSVKEVEKVDYSTPLTIKVLKSDNGGSISIQNVPEGMVYSLDDEVEKRPLKGGIMADRDGLIIRLYAQGTGNENKENGFLSIQCYNAECDVYGNIMSLLCAADDTDYSKFSEVTELPGKNTFKCLFSGGKVVSAKDLLLPAMTLKESCYERMFSGCTSLTQAPKLPATTLAKNCYANMFQQCTTLTSLTGEPDEQLPATNLSDADGCYKEMFYLCTNLAQAPELPATILAPSCYSGMFYDCKKLETAPLELPATELAEKCYEDMFYGCTNLKTAPPKLLATILAKNCYFRMFFSCSSLSESPVLVDPENLDAIEEGGYYLSMFSSCTHLNTVTCLFSQDTVNKIKYGMMGSWLPQIKGGGGGTFYHADGVTWPAYNDNNCYHGIPEGWVQKNISEKP